jgi:hypothetical protein
MTLVMGTGQTVYLQLTPQAVALAEITRQRALGWPDFHPEAYCHRCGQRNVYSWHAPDEVWNQVLDPAAIVCPQCFTELAREAGVEPSVWKLIDSDAPADAVPDGMAS